MWRSWTLAIVLAAIVGPALALEDDDDDAVGWRPQFVAVAKPADVKAAYPPAAFERKISGYATLACVAGSDGKLNDCTIFREDPVGQGFGAAALQLVGKERIKTKDASGAPVAGRPVKTNFQFLAPGDANPNWVKKPTSSALAGAFPNAAIKAGRDGRATIGCVITVEGFLEACKVLSEDPQGMGFGQAALQLAPQFRMSPKIRGGKPVPGGEVTVPVVWAGLANGGGRPAGQSLVLDPPWTVAPSAAQVAAAWPTAEAGDAPTGQAVLRCDLDKTGVPHACDVISENPMGKGFGKAAKRLSRSFQVVFESDQAKSLNDYKVDIPFRFRNPAGPEGRKLTKPRWIRTLTIEGMAQVYPEAAAAAGVTTGLGAASCALTTTGDLVECQAVREEPAGLDFAAAAIKAAGLIRMNPWTTEGDPVEGLRITLPIRFLWEAPPPAGEGDGAAKAPAKP